MVLTERTARAIPDNKFLCPEVACRQCLPYLSRFELFSGWERVALVSARPTNEIENGPRDCAPRFIKSAHHSAENDSGKQVNLSKLRKAHRILGRPGLSAEYQTVQHCTVEGGPSKIQPRLTKLFRDQSGCNDEIVSVSNLFLTTGVSSQWHYDGLVCASFCSSLAVLWGV